MARGLAGWLGCALLWLAALESTDSDALQALVARSVGSEEGHYSVTTTCIHACPPTDQPTTHDPTLRIHYSREEMALAPPVLGVVIWTILCGAIILLINVAKVGRFINKDNAG